MKRILELIVLLSVMFYAGCTVSCEQKCSDGECSDEREKQFDESIDEECESPGFKCLSLPERYVELTRKVRF